MIITIFPMRGSALFVRKYNTNVSGKNKKMNSQLLNCISYYHTIHLILILLQVGLFLSQKLQKSQIPNTTRLYLPANTLHYGS